MQKVFLSSLMVGLIFVGGSCTTSIPLVVDPVATPTPLPSLHPVSIPALRQHPTDGSDFRLGKVLEKNSVYTRYYITYRSGTLLISGIMNVPNGAVS